MKKVIFLLGALIALSGCDYAFPKIDSGYVRRMSSTGSAVTAELTFLQVSQLSDWFAAHRDGWAYEIADVAPGMLVTFRLKGADIVTVNFLGSQVRIGSRFRSLTIGESNALKRILDVEANQSLEPTPMLGTSAAEQPLVPAAVVAHL